MRLPERGLQVQLSDGEKLILLMLTDIYGHMGIKGDIDPKVVQSAIHNRCTWALDRKYAGTLFGASEIDCSIGNEVMNILDMWSFLEGAYEKLSGEDKDRVKTEAAPFGDLVKFTGFDRKNESEHLQVARFLIDDLKYFPEFKGRDLNSHVPSRDTYMSMRAVFEPMRPSIEMGDMGAERIIKVLNAKIRQ